MIAIIVIAVVIGVALIGWTLFRKWKLRPSNRFDERMQPIDFSPTDGFEKTHDEASRQRQEFVDDLDKGLVRDLDHDFTAGPSPVGAGYGYEGYKADPYYDQRYDQYGQAYPQDQYDQHAPHGYDQYPHDQVHDPYAPATYPPQPQGHPHPQPFDTPVQDDGYSHMQRASPPTSAGPTGQYELTADFSVNGRPTGGDVGPYAQAAAYRY